MQRLEVKGAVVKAKLNSELTNQEIMKKSGIKIVS